MTTSSRMQEGGKDDCRDVQQVDPLAPVATPTAATSSAAQTTSPITP